MERLASAFSPKRNVRLLFVREQGRHPALDGIRAIAILWVICLHAIWTRGLAKFPRDVYVQMLESRDPLLQLMLRGDLGVDVFFSLSGFLIGSILVRELAETGSLALGRFYVRRYLRLTPVYAVVIALFAMAPGFPNRERAWANLLYVNNFVTQHRQFMPWTWSLAVEEQFYVTMPLVLLVLFRRGRGVVLPGLAVLVAAGLAIRAVIALAHDLRFPMAPLTGNPQYDLMWDAIYVKPYARYGCFLPGVAAAFVHRTVPAERLRELLRRTSVWLFPLVCLASALVVYAPIFRSSARWPVHVGFAYMIGYGSLFGACVAYVILTCIHEVGPGKLLGRLLSLRIFTPIAQLSYATYLVHQPFAWMIYLKLRPGPAVGLVDHLPYIGLLGLVSFGFAAILHLLVERPFMHLRPRAIRLADAAGDPAAAQRESLRTSPTASASRRS